MSKPEYYIGYNDRSCYAKELQTFWEGVIEERVLSLEEALLSIPPSILYSNDRVKSKDTTRVNSYPLTSVLLWEDFFEEVSHFHFEEHPRFERPNFVVKEIINEEDVQGPDYIYSRQKICSNGIPDLNCHYLAKLLIVVIEVKREHILQDIGEQTFPDFYKMNKKIRNIVLDASIPAVISFGGIGNAIQYLYNEGLSNKNNTSNYKFDSNERSQQLQQSQSQ
ncbi:hypothetical protein C1646_745775 [Rhizophagus diaphanus]|nr:hypothetical protein C1646_745775 [Rhizophagus diaphanus] [Rhizophagus sp. MUCL 43196]